MQWKKLIEKQRTSFKNERISFRNERVAMKNERNSDTLGSFGDPLDTLGHFGTLWDAVVVTLSLGGGRFPT